MAQRTNLFLIGLLVWSLVLGILPAPVLAQENETKAVTVTDQMSLSQIADANQLPLAQLQERLGIKFDANIPIAEVKGANQQQLTQKITKVILETNMENSKDWGLIKLKFGLWLLLLITIGMLMKQARKLNKFRPILLLAGAILFGAILGAEPNSFGMIKDAFVVYGQQGIIFKPRVVAGTIMLLTVLFAGRLFCGWACQFGVLSDLMYRTPVRKFKLPLVITNSTRIIVFALMVIFALGYSYDLLGTIDPFKIYGTPTNLILITTSTLLVLSMFIYRPFCTMVCPFGLVASLIDKVSFLGIRFNKSLCTNCQNCHKVCPTGSIVNLHEGHRTGECFTCNSCQEVCPNKAITYGKK